MMKFFTLVAAAMLAVCANAQNLDYVVTGPSMIDEGTVLVDNDYITVSTANNDQFPTLIKNEDDEAAPIEYFGYSFPYYLGVRVTDAPTKDEPTGTAHESNVALVVVAKQNTDVSLYYKVGATKSIDCYDQTAGESVSIEQEASNPGEEYLYCRGVYKLQGGHTYTVWARGGTIQFHGLKAAEGTYVAPTTNIYANTGATVVDGFSTMSYGDGAKVALTGNAEKAFSSGSSITIDGKNYTSTKVSNGAANTFYAPEGKKVYTFTIYSYVNIDSENRTPYWAQVGDKEYTADDANIMKSYKDGKNPDVNTYTFAEGLSEVVFKNAGEQVCFVLEVDYNASSLDGVAAIAAEQSVNAPVYNLAGQKVDAQYKGVVIKNGQKQIQK